ncbi:MAG TPA: hypothetical protein VI997_11060 [Candidatus Thermoplasmatota archaeon]|nr:hypothetical protein [Candidatus Thermoplasmatota archaeon]
MRAHGAWRAMVALSILAIAVPPASATGEVDLDLVLSSPSSATARVVRTWTGEEASAVRVSLDDAFGNGDGELVRKEIDALENATEASMIGQAFPLARARESPSRVVDVKADLEGDARSFRARHVVGLALANGTGTDGVIALSLGPFGNGTLHVKAPDGWMIRLVEGAEEPLVAGGVLTAHFGSGTVTVTLDRVPASRGDEGPRSAGVPEESRDAIPGSSAIIVAIGALLVATSRRR